jgi:hypothetical protein
MRRWSWIPILLATASLGSLSGCGSAEEGSSAPSTSGPALAAASSKDITDAPPAVDEMSVFSRPRTEADGLPSELSYRVKGHKDCPESVRAQFGCPGDPIADESRLLLSGLGVRQTSLYAWPTTNGWVCWAWAEGAGGCQADFAPLRQSPGFMGIDPDDEGIGYPGTLVGIVPDDVAAAEVRVRGTSHAAIVGSNAIFYELPDSSCTNWAFDSVTVRYRDGRSATAPITWQQGSSELPETCAA